MQDLGSRNTDLRFAVRSVTDSVQFPELRDARMDDDSRRNGGDSLALQAGDADAALAEVLRSSDANPEQKLFYLRWVSELRQMAADFGVVSSFPEALRELEDERDEARKRARWYHRLTPGEVMLGVLGAGCLIGFAYTAASVRAVEASAKAAEQRTMETQEAFLRYLEAQGENVFRVPDSLRQEVHRLESE